MSEDRSVSQWIAGLKAGDEEAAQQLWERYFDKLVGLALRKLQKSPRRVQDEEDVALNAFDSLCRGAKAGKFPLLSDREDLWRLLVVITARKASDQIHHGRRQKRGGGQVRGESVFQGGDANASHHGIEQVIGDEPTPQFATQIAEEMELFLDRLDDDTLRKIALWKLENYTNLEMAEKLGVSDETIRRKLQRIKMILERMDEA